MYPTIRLGSVSISTYWLMYGVGLFSMLVWVLIRRKKYNLSVSKCIVFTLFLAILGTLGTKILAILESALRYAVTGTNQPAGMSFYGAVFLVFGTIGLCGLVLKLKPEDSRDLSAIPGLSQVAFMRIGCFLNGCCGGWLVTIGNKSFHWPTQVIESFFDFLIIAWLLVCESKNKRHLYPRFMLSYGIVRFLLEFLRDTEKIYLHMSDGQWCSLISITIAIIALVLKRSEKKENA